MMRSLLLLSLVCLSLFVARAETDSEAAARKLALDLAGAFANDGFKLRDGHWSGPIAPGKPQLLEVNLYSGNQYWFTVAADGGAKKVAVTVYDETGRPVATEPYAEEGKAAAGFSPEASGPYFIKVEVISGEATTFCLIYSYK